MLHYGASIPGLQSLDIEHWLHKHIDGLVQDYSISSALAMGIRQSCKTPSILIHVQNIAILWTTSLA